MTRTVAEIAKAVGVDEPAARGLIKFLSVLDPPMARFRGERKPAGGGRGPHVYEIDTYAAPVVSKLLVKLL